MALPSQSVSQNARGRYMYRRKRRRRFPTLAMLACAAIACGGVWWYLDSRSQTPAESSEPTASATAPTAPVAPSSAARFDAQRRSRALETTVTAAPPEGWTAGLGTTEPSPPPAPAPTQAPAPAPVTETAATTPPPTAPITPETNFFVSGTGDATIIQQARQLLGEDRPVEARTLLSNALGTGTLTPAQLDEARYMLTSINDRLIFSPEVVPGDPFVTTYTVKKGDSLGKIVKSLGVQVDWRFLQRVNGLTRPNQIRPGQVLKIVTGPFHASVERNSHRLDLYIGEGPNEVFVRNFLVGLGEHGCTPSGLFRVRRNSKLVNPPWTNPRTREHYAANDPENPIGEFWLGLEGIDDHNRQEAGFGIHGTIEPESIGRNESMGCVRMRTGEIDMIYEVLTEGVSTIWVDNGVQAASVPGG
ncbi:MAG: L,D-transpeptidase family protein [Planctomycetota bacterium]|nr:L,D-transpeptidase family protein [Planctomycetota bacterium]